MKRLVMMPPSRLSDLTERLYDIRSKDSGGPCGSFTFAYHYMCDYYAVPFNEEVAWVMLNVFIQNKLFLLSIILSTLLIHHHFSMHA